MGLVCIYTTNEEEKRETIPVIQNAGLEYNITTMIKRMTDSNKRSIGIANFSETDMKLENVKELLKQNYNVFDIKLDNPVQNNIDALIISGIIDTLDDGKINHLEQYLNSGGSIFIAQNRISTDLSTQSALSLESNIYNFLEKYGLGIKDNLVKSIESGCDCIFVCNNRKEVENICENINLVGDYELNEKMLKLQNKGISENIFKSKKRLSILDELKFLDKKNQMEISI